MSTEKEFKDRPSKHFKISKEMYMIFFSPCTVIVNALNAYLYVIIFNSAECFPLTYKRKPSFDLITSLVLLVFFLTLQLLELCNCENIHFDFKPSPPPNASNPLSFREKLVENMNT